MLSNQSCMVLTKSNILLAFIILLCVSFTLFQVQEEFYISAVSRALIVPLITVLYFMNTRDRSLYFSWFLLFFSISELIVFTEYFLQTGKQLHVYYFVGNLLYILAYLSLLIDIIKGLNFKKVFKNYKLQLFVLGVLNIYIVYMLLSIVNPIIKNTNWIYLELIYNTVILLLLTFSLISYFYNDNKKTLLCFIATLFIVFSEFVQIAYFYISDKNMLNFISTFLFVMAFGFYYFYARTRSVKTFRLFN